jgi:hypothetical protein
MNFLNKNNIITIIAVLIAIGLAFVLYTSLFVRVPEQQPNKNSQMKIQSILPYGTSLNFDSISSHASSTNSSPSPKVDPGSVGITNLSDLIKSLNEK